METISLEWRIYFRDQFIKTNEVFREEYNELLNHPDKNSQDYEDKERLFCDKWSVDIAEDGDVRSRSEEYEKVTAQIMPNGRLVLGIDVRYPTKELLPLIREEIKNARDKLPKEILTHFKRRVKNPENYPLYLEARKMQKEGKSYREIGNAIKAEKPELSNDDPVSVGRFFTTACGSLAAVGVPGLEPFPTAE